MPTTQTFTRTQYALLALVFLGLALYGSLVPFRYTPIPFEEAISRFRQIRYLQLGLASRSDWVANILLFVPLSFLIMAAITADRKWVVALIAAFVVIPFCAAMSMTIEFVQVFFPPRTVSINDIVAESIGGTVGTFLWVAAGQRITVWARQVWNATEGYGLAGRLLWGYVFVLVFIHVMPLDLTISPVEVYRKYREGRVVLIPFSTPYGSLMKLVEKNVWNVIYFLPVGFLLAKIRGWGEHWQLWPKALLVGLSVSGLIEFLQVFVYTRFTDTTDIFTGTQAVLIGWSAALLDRGMGSEVKPGAYRIKFGDAAPAKSNRMVFLRILLLVLWSALLIFLNWQPFDFIFDPAPLAQRLQHFSFVPFADYYVGTEYNAFDQILRKTLIFMPIGIIVTSGLRGRTADIVATVVGLVLSLTFEFGQFFLITRYPSVSDVLVETFGAWVGYRFVRWLHGIRFTPAVGSNEDSGRGGTVLWTRWLTKLRSRSHGDTE